ncbi:facilitated trehalose transporter Tret1-like isoform X2 [Rhodnius prolixus]|uniref:facilitated trehalose transporter Tret1-like isoform X2 n=1 Tax=Rhodnius prolixus TaxID=13249 RepID=UPI003D18AB4E
MEPSQTAESAENESQSSIDDAPISRCLAQVVACTANNLIVLSIGLVISFPTILLGALYTNPQETLTLDDEQASWFGSIFVGLIMEPLGRKRSMILLNIPFLIGWTMIVFAESAGLLFAAGAILGFGVGCTEAPAITYIGEVCEPKYRGALSAFAVMWFQLGYLCVYGLGSVLSWRYIAAVCVGVQVLTALSVAMVSLAAKVTLEVVSYMIPETPLWLISKGRIQSAEKALCWLRGWTKPESVKEELNRLIEYHRTVQEDFQEQNQKVLASTGSQEILIPRKISLKERIKYFFRPEMRQPLSIVIWYMFFVYATGLQTVRPYFMHIFSELNVVDMGAHQLTVLMAVLGLAGTILCTLTVRHSGKRTLSLLSVGGCGLCTLGLSLVGFLVLPYSWSVPLLLLFSLFTGLGLAPLPWMLQSEMYPFYGKCMAIGIASALSYLMGFCAIKSFLALEKILQLSGVFLLFTSLSVFAGIYLAVRLPETEGKTFGEIQSRFN